jgi:uncharacterized membrane protein
MNQDLLDWMLLLGRWIHITTGVTWIGSSIFFMWLDRSFVRDDSAITPGHLGKLWMVHGGGFYKVEKLQMGSVEVPAELHWFKWESYWTWMSGFFLFSLIFFTGSGTFLLDPASALPFSQAVIITLGSIFGSWFIYDLFWESKLTRNIPAVGHLLTAAWLVGMSYFLCHTLSGRAAYMVVGAIIGTWMTGNVFMRIIPRQLKMVEAAKRGESADPSLSKNAKNRSTHNTYLTLPVIFVMLSNHFPSTYGHALNWLVLILMCAAGALIREFFVVRISAPARSKICAALGMFVIFVVAVMTKTPADPASEISANTEAPSTSADSAPTASANPSLPETPATTSSTPPTSVPPAPAPNPDSPAAQAMAVGSSASFGPAGADRAPLNLRGLVRFSGVLPERKKLTLPQGCAKAGKASFSNEILVNNGKIQNVVVRVIRGQETLEAGPVPTTAVELNQNGCLYEPRVIAARVNQEVIFVNSDPVFHNVRSLAKENPNFNLAMPMKNQRISRRFLKPEIFLQTQCSVHPWMGAYLAISDHPFIAVSDPQGAFEIRGLPAGHYELEFWHEVFGTQRREVDLSAHSVPIEITFTR